MSLEAKIKKIKLLILDVDGVLTSGIIYYSPNGSHIKGFHVFDGLGLKLLRQSGVEVAVISAKKSPAVSMRLTELKIEHIYLGYEKKIAPYEEIKTKLQLSDNEIAYMGDDLPDLPLLKRVGLRLTVPSAPKLIQQHVDFVTTKKAGKGAVREVCELIMTTQNTFLSVVESYLS